MSIENFIPAIWSTQIQQTLKNELVFGGLVNRKFEGEVKKGGSVTVFRVGEIAIKDMPTATDDLGTPREIDSAQGVGVTSITLNIDKQKYFNFGVDDVSKVQRDKDLFTDYVTNASYGLKSAMDKAIVAELTSGAGVKVGSDSSPVAVNGDTIYNTILKLKINLDRNNAPAIGRCLVVSPEIEAILLEDNRFIYVGTGGNALANGKVFKACGFDISVSNDIAYAGTGKTKMYAFHKDAIAFVEQIMTIEPYRLERGFSDAVKGLAVFGTKVIEPKHVVVASVQVQNGNSGASGTPANAGTK